VPVLSVVEVPVLSVVEVLVLSVVEVLVLSVVEVWLILKVFMHSLLICYILIRRGTDLIYIQLLIGHSSTRTTEVYIQVAINNIKANKSPLDNLHLK
jgi:integrase/recombinase XerD